MKNLLLILVALVVFVFATATYIVDERETAIKFQFKEIVESSPKEVVKINPKFYRPAEVALLIGDPEKAKKELGWEPKTSLEELCNMMVEADVRRNKAGKTF